VVATARRGRGLRGDALLYIPLFVGVFLWRRVAEAAAASA